MRKLFQLANEMGEGGTDGLEDALDAAREELAEEKGQIEDKKTRLASCK